MSNKLFIIIVSVLMILSLGGNISQYFSLNKFKKEKTQEFEKLKAEKDAIITSQYQELLKIKVDFALKDSLALEQENTIDSILKLKDSVKIVFKYKYKEIGNFTSNKVENYWKDEFSN